MLGGHRCGGGETAVSLVGAFQGSSVWSLQEWEDPTPLVCSHLDGDPKVCISKWSCGSVIADRGMSVGEPGHRGDRAGPSLSLTNPAEILPEKALGWLLYRDVGAQGCLFSRNEDTGHQITQLLCANTSPK